MEGDTLNLLKRTNTAGKDGTEPKWPSAFPKRHTKLCLIKYIRIGFKRQCTQVAYSNKNPLIILKYYTTMEFL